MLKEEHFIENNGRTDVKLLWSMFWCNVWVDQLFSPKTRKPRPWCRAAVVVQLVFFFSVSPFTSQYSDDLCFPSNFRLNFNPAFLLFSHLSNRFADNNKFKSSGQNLLKCGFLNIPTDIKLYRLGSQDLNLLSKRWMLTICILVKWIGQKLQRWQ